MRGLAEAAPDDLVLISDAMKSPNPLTWSECITVFESEAYLHDLNAESRLLASCSHRSCLPGIICAIRRPCPRLDRASARAYWGPALELVRPLLGLRPLLGRWHSWSQLGYRLPVQEITDQLRAYSQPR